MKTKPIPTSAKIVSAALFAAMLIGVMAFFVKVFSAAPYRTPVVLDRHYDRSAMQEALAPAAVQARWSNVDEFVSGVEELGLRAEGLANPAGKLRVPGLCQHGAVAEAGAILELVEGAYL